MSTYSNVKIAVNSNTVLNPGNIVLATIEPIILTYSKIIPTLKDRLRNDNN
jgi:hypothetical protein